MARLLAAAFGLLVWAMPLQCSAAWPQPKGDLLIISTLSDYNAKARYDALGVRAPAGEYHKQELSVYGVYGLTGGLTAGAQPVFVRVRARSSFGGKSESINSLSHIELFARQRLFTGDDWIISAQALVKLNGGHAVDREPLLDTSSRDIEARLLYGQSGQTGKYLRNMEYFSTFEAAIRRRDHDTADQLRSDAAFGIRPWPKFQIIAQSFNTIALQQGDDLDPRAFDLYKAQLSLLRDLPHGAALQIGGFTEYAGRNISAGNAFFMAIWTRF